MGGWGHFWSDQVLWVRESNALIQERTFTPIIEQYCICTWFQFAGNFIIFVAMDTMGREKEVDQRLCPSLISPIQSPYVISDAVQCSHRAIITKKSLF